MLVHLGASAFEDFWFELFCEKWIIQTLVHQYRGKRRAVRGTRNQHGRVILFPSSLVVSQIRRKRFLPPRDAPRGDDGGESGYGTIPIRIFEADGDGALSMEILKLVSGGKPVLFMDVSYIDDDAQVFYLPNCGAFCSWYAKRSDDPAENLKQVKLHPANRPGGGAITYFNPAPGPLTFARLYRKNGEYYMAIVAGETIELPPEKYEAFVQARGNHPLPTAFAKLHVDIDVFMNEFASNHILAVDGIYVRELEHLCQLLDITPMIYNNLGVNV